jgi:molybdopterin-guanine dinucleotide biosynthesis protein A
VHAALAQRALAWVLAVAGDMPFLDGAAVLPLLEARGDDVDAVAYTVAGRLEPLAALYRSALASRWAEALAGGAARSVRCGAGSGADAARVGAARRRPEIPARCSA